MNKPLSNCCDAEVITAHGCDADFGHNGKPCNCAENSVVTMWYECTKCKKPCDTWQDHMPFWECNNAEKWERIKHFINNI